MVNTQLAFFSMNTESNYNVKTFFSYGNSVCTKYPIHDTLKDFWKRFFLVVILSLYSLTYTMLTIVLFTSEQIQKSQEPNLKRK